MRTPSPFHRLSWKLTISYSLVTVGTLLVIELCLLLGLQIVASTDALAWTVAGILRTEAVPRLKDILQEKTPDINLLKDDLASWFPIDETGVANDFSDDSILPLSGNGQVLILDRSGVLLARQPDKATPIPMLIDVLPEALSGGTDLTRLSRRDGSSITTALPIKADDGQLLGVIVVYTQQTRTLTDNLKGILQLAGLSFAIFTGLAGLIGTVFGFFTARGFARRLGRVAEASAAWGQGDFRPAIHDPSTDELGQLARQLNAMSQQLQELMQVRQQLAAVDERNRLARDLHDSVKQQVFAISMNLGAIQNLWGSDPDKARARLESTAQLAQQTQQSLSELIQALRPRALESHGLVQALPELLKEWENSHEIQTGCQVGCPADIPQPVEQALFRVAQEALANIAKHSGAHRVNLKLQGDTAGITLQIEDDGHGFDTKQSSSGFGLHSMRERVEALGGTLTLDSDAQGTRLVAWVPLKAYVPKGE